MRMEAMTVRLSDRDADLFYDLFMPLLQLANEQSGLFPSVRFARHRKTDPGKAHEVAQWLWARPGLIDTYLAAHPEITGEGRDILAGWKKCVGGFWFIERHLKAGSVFLGSSGSALLVTGINSTVEEMVGMHGTPIAVQTAVLPFRDRIITDGLIAYMPISVGPGIRDSLKEQYMAAKEAGRVFTTLTDEYLREERKARERKDEGPEDSGDIEDEDADPDELAKENERWLKLFDEDLTAAGLADRTIGEHLTNANLFLNDYLAFHEGVPMKEGTGRLDSFFLFFYIRKCVWASGADLKRVCASLKKFYKCMLAHGLIGPEDFAEVTEQIRDRKDAWLEALLRFDEDEDPDALF